MRNYDLGNRIYELRKQKNLSQKELGNLLGVSNKSVSKWENGVTVPKTETLVKLAGILGVSPQELLQGKTDDHFTLRQLSSQTNELFLTNEIEQKDKIIKNQNAFNQKKYLIIILSLFISSFVLSFILSSIGLFIDVEANLKWYEILFDSLILAYLLCSIFSSIVFVTRTIKKAPSWLLVLLCIFFPITLLIVEFIGLIITPSYIIISIREIWRERKNG